MKYLQYYLDTGLVKASNSLRVPDDYLPEGVGQFECEDDVDPARVRVSGDVLEAFEPGE